MGSRVEKVAVADLVPGLYVDRLDRPWTETPFPFQGFLIRDEDQVDTLRRYCKHVYVDLLKSDEVAEAERVTTVVDARKVDRTVPEALRATVPNLRAAEARRVAAPGATGTALGRPARSYERAHSVEQEVAVAEHIHAEAMHAARELILRLLEEGRLDLELARETVEPMMGSVLRNPDALIWLTRIKEHDDHGYQHAVACSVWGMAFARHLGLAQGAIYEVGLGCLLHDVGNTRLNGAMLDRHGSLTTTERAAMQEHVQHGLDILGAVRGITPRVMDVVRCHHERFDGSGYPAGMRGLEIPTFAKIAGMVDCYDALVSPRPHAQRIAPHEAIRAIYRWRGTLFQAEVVERFIQVVGAFPVGSLVQLNTGAVGAVIAQNEARRLRPRLMLLLDQEQRPLPRPHLVDLMHDEPWRETQQFWIDKHLAPGAYGIDPRRLSL
jgi:HD-GYP domain-containing protein (c-di-GMP phosphodiesterase class II)